MLYGATNSPLRPILDEVKAIAELKFDYLELAMDPPYCDSKNLKKQKWEIQETLKQHDLELVCHLPNGLCKSQGGEYPHKMWWVCSDISRRFIKI